MNRSKKNSKNSYKKIVLAVHGGAGVISKEKMTAIEEQNYLKALTSALQAGYKVLTKNRSSLDAVEAAVKVLENSPLFNAGHGSVFTCEGRIELDAAIMDGASKKAGSVAFVETIKNPITAARAVMEKSKHVMLVGKGAEKFAQEAKLELVDTSYFWTSKRWLQLKQIQKIEKQMKGKRGTLFGDHKFGTVGAVAVDKKGNLAAATSTGGIVNKRYGRIGDSPIIGAGVWADNTTCAMSATGDGEYFIRAVAGHEIASLIKYKKLNVSAAAKQVVQKQVKPAGGLGGVIVLDAKGNLAIEFSTPGMYRGYVTEDGEITVAMFG